MTRARPSGTQPAHVEGRGGALRRSPGCWGSAQLQSSGSAGPGLGRLGVCVGGLWGRGEGGGHHIRRVCTHMVEGQEVQEKMWGGQDPEREGQRG